MKKEYQAPATRPIKFRPAVLSSVSRATRLESNDTGLQLGDGSDGSDQRARSSSVWDE